ncbi:flagellar biosynthesis protein FlhF [Candidatus Contubernalis alkaliaceticus]|uniref:flagellar biosynthesis protein FlhF n=1 Tax=Candidatus Contubernalis alkaliaceticus TaxID=338645 RepID=UPI001F4C42A0|nr:flagellar biosynthesis protein FlhF [Candidatus Contubernalis alkalaceticus]UNC91762.1 flagellar biosynthesis protein FlhF [Candidatus Contubernalis alkalaceticus]
MKIKKYRALTMQEGLAQVKRELGPDAVIIESKKVRQKGIKGFFVGKGIEITAAIDTFVLPHDNTLERETISSNSRMEQEMYYLKGMMNRLLKQQEKSQVEGSSSYNSWLKRLVDNDLDSEIARDLLAGIQESAQDKDVSLEMLEILITNKIKDMLVTSEVPGKIKYISFVGPTGVGKTTTLAKLAAYHTFEEQKKVGIITVDTYRIGAVEQLKAYAGITGIPVEVVFTSEEMKETIEKFKDKDIVLVDTAGRSSKSVVQLSETASFLNCLPKGAGAVFLVVSATTKPRDLKRIAQGYKRLGYNYLVFTKMDETETYGVLFNMCCYTGMPIVYITTGQNVPEDIEASDDGKLANMVMGVD